MITSCITPCYPSVHQALLSCCHSHQPVTRPVSAHSSTHTNLPRCAHLCLWRHTGLWQQLPHCSPGGTASPASCNPACLSPFQQASQQVVQLLSAAVLCCLTGICIGQLQRLALPQSNDGTVLQHFIRQRHTSGLLQMQGESTAHCKAQQFFCVCACTCRW